MSKRILQIVLVAVAVFVFVKVAKADDVYKSFGDRGICRHQVGDPSCDATPPAITATKTTSGFSVTATTKYGSNSYNSPYLNPNGPANCCNADLSWKEVIYRGFNSTSEVTYSYNGHNIKIRYVPTFYHDPNTSYGGTIIKPGIVTNYDETRFNFADYAGYSRNVATSMGPVADGIMAKGAITDIDASLILCIYRATYPLGCFGGSASPRPTQAEITAFRNYVNNYISSSTINTTFYQVVWPNDWNRMEGCNFTGPAINNSFTGTINKNYTFDTNLKYRVSILEQVGSAACFTDGVHSLDQFRYRAPVDLVITTPKNGQCGEADNHHFAYNETTYTSTYDQCNVGNPSSTAFPVQGGSTTWTCSGVDGGSTSATCRAYRDAAPVSGQCGTARYQNHIFTQTERFPGSYTYCATGTAIPNPPGNPPAGGSSTWSCVGANGGTTVPCEARRQLNGQCGNAQGNYTAYETVYRSTFCNSGSRINYVNRFPNTGETISSAWQCQGTNGGSTATCSVSRDALAAYDLWIYENTCTGNVGDTIDIATSDTATINWNPDPNDVSILDINGKTLCYEAHQNCSAGNIKTIGREYRTYNCSVPETLLYDPASIEIKSRSQQLIGVSVQCSGGEVLPLDHDAITSNNVDWNVNGRFSALQSCNSPTSISYSAADQYMLSTGNSDRDCTQTLETRVANYIFGGYSWGEVTGLLPITILQEYFTVDYDCPECGTKYMDVDIEVPLVQCD